MKDMIFYDSYLSKFDTGTERIYLFYPDGVWDEHKLTLDQAEERYPTDKYVWIKLEE
jgi:hypothetical protein